MTGKTAEESGNFDETSVRTKFSGQVKGVSSSSAAA